MLRQGFGLLGHDPALDDLIANTLRLAIESTAIALLLGLPLAYWLSARATRARGIGRTIANAGLGLPPVGVGVYAFLLLPGTAPWGGYWLGTWNAVILVQTVLALPIVVALCATAFLRLPAGLIDQARAFGASGWRLALFVVREAKVGVISAVILSMASAIGEVGAITIVSSNAAVSPTVTLAVSVLNDQARGGGVNRTDYVAFSVEHAIVMLAMLLVLGGLLTIVQQWGTRPRRRLALLGAL
jgi:tungstate transport system permease protein